MNKPPTPAQKTHYERLGVSYYGSADDVRKGCERRLASLDRMRADGVDEDLPAQAAERREIMTAYMTLKDGVRRNAYNATLAAASAEHNAMRERENNAGLVTSGWSGLGAQPLKSDATFSEANSVTTVRTNNVAASPVIREAPVDLRAAAQLRIAERARNRDARGGDADDAQWADDATLGVRYVAMLLDTMAVCIIIALALALRSVLFANATPWFLLSGTTMFMGTSVVTVAYYAWGECGGHRATLGKRVMGLQVLRMDGLTRVGVLRAAVRYGLRLVGSYGLMLGYLMAFFTERKQALHDKLTDTLVVSVRPPFAPALWVGMGATLAFAGLVYGLAVRVVASVADGVTPAITEVLGAPSFDPNRATPSRAEVQLAYYAARSMQQAALRFHRERGDWPSPADVNALVAGTEQPETLARYAPKILPLGMFALSLGATATGSAYLVFTPDDDGPQAAWSCAAIRVDPHNLPNSCVASR